jgi:hypothetical protein
MTYVIANAARVRMTDGSMREFTGNDAAGLYLAHDASDHPAKVLERLGGRNEFERTLQRKIVDWVTRAAKPNRRRVMIIGDSIRMRLCNATGYGIHAYRRLIDHFNLIHIPHNTGGTIAVKLFLENWMTARPDIVHINTGLHDLVFDPQGKRTPITYTSPEVYKKNLQWIISTIRASGVQTVIWGRCTPIQEQWHMENPNLGRRLSDVRLYNDIADSVMRSLDVPINDLFQPMLDAGLERCVVRDGVHLSQEGSALLGRLVAEWVLQTQQ